MNAQSKKLTQLAASILMALAVGSAWAANTITFEGDPLADPNGQGNYANIKATGTGTATVFIYQVGSGDGSAAAKQNQVGAAGATNELILNGGNGTTATAHIGQGAYYDGSSWTKTHSVQNNIVKGTITSGTVEVSQNSGDATTIANEITLDINGSGKVIVNQGDVTGSGKGTGLKASVTQTGAGTVTINQGNSDDSVVTAGTATVVHAGSHSVNITQNSTANANVGTVLTNTAGGPGSLDITQSNNGKVYVNKLGTDNNGNAATITGTAILNNSGTGTLAIKEGVAGTVKAYTTGTIGVVTIDNSLGAGNEVYVNTDGTKGSTTAATINGTVSVTSGGTSNVVYVKDLASGNVNVVQNADALGMEGSSLRLSGTQGGLTSTATLNQNGEFLDVTAISLNGSNATFNLNEVGVTGSHATLNLTF